MTRYKIQWQSELTLILCIVSFWKRFGLKHPGCTGLFEVNWSLAFCQQRENIFKKSWTKIMLSNFIPHAFHAVFLSIYSHLSKRLYAVALPQHDAYSLHSNKMCKITYSNCQHEVAISFFSFRITLPLIKHHPFALIELSMSFLCLPILYTIVTRRQMHCKDELHLINKEKRNAYGGIQYKLHTEIHN